MELIDKRDKRIIGRFPLLRPLIRLRLYCYKLICKKAAAGVVREIARYP